MILNIFGRVGRGIYKNRLPLSPFVRFTFTLLYFKVTFSRLIRFTFDIVLLNHASRTTVALKYFILQYTICLKKREILQDFFAANGKMYFS